MIQLVASGTSIWCYGSSIETLLANKRYSGDLSEFLTLQRSHYIYQSKFIINNESELMSFIYETSHPIIQSHKSFN